MTDLQSILTEAHTASLKNSDGSVANYIPELASVDTEYTAVALTTNDGKTYTAGDDPKQKFTLQSTAKLIILIGLLEEYGLSKVLSWTRVEPSGDDFASIARLDQFGPMPSNPMLNAGAITLCSYIPGPAEERVGWLENWIKKLFGAKLSINAGVFASEKRTGDRNRSLAYLLKSSNLLQGEVKDVLETYFCLCSFEADVVQASYLSMILANGGKNAAGEQVISRETTQDVVAIMATCGLYNESGTHLVKTGMPAKSGVSGFILAVAPRYAGIATISPRVNRKGTSMRGEIILTHIKQNTDWHFAT